MNDLIENNPPAPEVSPPAPVQAENPPGESVPAPPPAAQLVITGEVRSEREIQLERDLETERKRARNAEILAAEKEREAQDLRAGAVKPAPFPAASTPKGTRWWMPIIGTNEESE
jgi:hypothetical protein